MRYAPITLGDIVGIALLVLLALYILYCLLKKNPSELEENIARIVLFRNSMWGEDENLFPPINRYTIEPCPKCQNKTTETLSGGELKICYSCKHQWTSSSE